MPQEIIDYENGILSNEETIALFQQMIDTGLVWHMGDTYRAVASSMLRNGLCIQARQEIVLVA